MPPWKGATLETHTSRSTETLKQRHLHAHMYTQGMYMCVHVYMHRNTWDHVQKGEAKPLIRDTLLEQYKENALENKVI